MDNENELEYRQKRYYSIGFVNKIFKIVNWKTTGLKSIKLFTIYIIEPFTSILMVISFSQFTKMICTWKNRYVRFEFVFAWDYLQFCFSLQHLPIWTNMLKKYDHLPVTNYSKQYIFPRLFRFVYWPFTLFYIQGVRLKM